MSFLKPGVFLQEKDMSLIIATAGDVVLQAVQDAGWGKLGIIPSSLRNDCPDDSYFWGVTPTMVAVLEVWRDVRGVPLSSQVVVKINMSDLPPSLDGYFAVDGYSLIDFILTHQLTRHAKDLNYKGTEPPESISWEEVREHFKQEQLRHEKDLQQLRDTMSAIHAKLKFEYANV